MKRGKVKSCYDTHDLHLFANNVSLIFVFSVILAAIVIWLWKARALTGAGVWIILKIAWKRKTAI